MKRYGETYRRIAARIICLTVAAALICMTSCSAPDETLASASTSSSVSPPAPSSIQTDPPPAPPSDGAIYDNAQNQGKLAVRFLGLNDIGTNNGEASLITFPDGKTMLVDTGFEEKSADLLDILEQSGLTRIDTLLITHYHGDHTGGAAQVLEKMEVGHVYLPEFPEYRGTEDDELLKALESRAIPYTYVKEGMKPELSEEVEVEILNPVGTAAYPEGMVEKKEKSAFENNNSVVFMMTHGSVKLLFTGDVYADAETRLIKAYGEKLKCNLLKVPHHGLSTSSSTLFLMETMPEWSVIMSGQPSTGIYNSVSSRSNARVTGAYGTVLAVSDGQTLEVSTEHEDASNGVYS